MDVVRRFWELLEERAWEEAAGLLADDFICEWPNTGERFLGRDNFMGMNRAYPSSGWHIEVLQTVDEGDSIAAEVHVPDVDAGTVDFCLGFYKVEDGLIKRATEYWVERRPASPEWRAQWVERIDSKA